MNRYGYIKVASIIPEVKVADCEFNTSRIVEMSRQAAERGVRIAVFPELCITAYSCGDLFTKQLLINKAQESLANIAEATAELPIVLIVGLPVAYAGKLYDSAAVVSQGEILGVVPKSIIPNTGEANDLRWFTPSADSDEVIEIAIAGQCVPFGRDMLFSVNGVDFGVEIGDDLLAVVPPSAYKAMAGAKIIFNLAATSELAGKRVKLTETIKAYSSRILAGYVYASAGWGESTSDLVYAGNAFIAENGEMLASGERFKMNDQMVISDIDIEALSSARLTSSTFASGHISSFAVIETLITAAENERLDRVVDPSPFIPDSIEDRNAWCEEIFEIQSQALAKRMVHTYCKCAVIGISGGLDSTLALLATVRTFDKLGLDRKGIIGITMPGFGTTDRTYQNAVTLIKELGVTFREISIADACRQHFKDIGLPDSDRSVTYENSQARERTQILMDIANMENGMVVGTGDMSELALGWATYNGDQMSMYGVNCSIPKTLMRHMVEWVAANEPNQKVRAALRDVVATPVSPELLPADEKGDIAQKTEDLVGPYELHDFFLYNFIGKGFSPAKIVMLAEKAFEGSYNRATIVHWIKTFFRRFFNQQFKRSASPDGPKVSEVSISAKGDWRMPADASSAVWLAECEKL
ncbi:MAG: NAD(+) synthase [Rikenellaceae bacterium]|nr:NAD(+) synthase [Rikenellaceae bacterium]